MNLEPDENYVAVIARLTPKCKALMHTYNPFIDYILEYLREKEIPQAQFAFHLSFMMARLWEEVLLFHAISEPVPGVKMTARTKTVRFLPEKKRKKKKRK